MVKYPILHLGIYLLLSLFLITKAQSLNGPLERAGAWSFGPAVAVDVDTNRDLIFLSSGGSVLILNGTDRTNPQLISDGINTLGLVEDLYYDSLTQRLYVAAGEGGLDIWNVSIPSSPQHISTKEVQYFGVEVPVGNVDVFGNFAIVECGYGYVHSLDVSDPLNPIDVSFNGTMGNPAHDLYVSPDGQAHTTGAQYYVRLAIQPDGTFNTSSSREFNFGAGAVYGTESYAYVGYAGNLYILELPNAAAIPLSITDVNGIGDIIVQNNLAFIINSSGLQIWNVSNPNNPALTGQLTQSVYGSKMALAEGYLYIANSHDGLRIIDVNNPISPVEVGSYDVYSGTPDAFINGNYAYLSQYGDGMTILDISNPSSPQFMSNFSAADYVDEIYVQGDYAYVADFYGGLRIVDVSDPLNPFEVGNLNTLQAWRVRTAGNYAYVINATANNPDSLVIVDISNPNSPQKVGAIEVFNITWDIDVSGNYVYISANDDGLRIVDVSNPANPTLIGSYTNHSVNDVQVVGNIAYIVSSDFNGGFITLDVSNPALPLMIHQYNPSGFRPFDVAVIGNYAYISSPIGQPDIFLLDITNPNNPIELDDFVPPIGASDIQAIGPYLYLADGPAGLQILRNTLIPIPVELTSFTATNLNNHIRLNWSTATETNNFGFEVQRKEISSDWQKIGFVTGHGTSTETNSYEYVDDISPLSFGSYLYRLKQMDFDGSFEYSHEVLVTNITPYTFLLEQNFPNPFNPNTVIKYSIAQTGVVTLKVYNILGKEITTLVNERKEAGNYEVTFDASELATGIYLYSIQSGDFSSIKKMLLLK